MRLVKAVLAFAVALSCAAPAAAQGLTGEWTRDDGKVYLFSNYDAIVTTPGEWGCRLSGDGIGSREVKLTCRFTRSADEGGYFETKAETVGWPSHDRPDEVTIRFEWVELGEEGERLASGTEQRVLRRTRKLSTQEAWRCGQVIRAHARADACLDPEDRLFDPARALQQLKEWNEMRADPTLAPRIEALEKRGVGPSKEERAKQWLEAKRGEVEAAGKAKDAAALERLGREAMHGPPGGNGAGEECFSLAAQALSKARNLAPENDEVAFACAAALYWCNVHDGVRDVLGKLEARNAAARDARFGRPVAEWLRRLEAARSHDERYQALNRQANEMQSRGQDGPRYERLREEASEESEKKGRESEIFVQYFYGGTATAQ